MTARTEAVYELVFQGRRQRSAFRLMSMCYASEFHRFAYGVDQLLNWQAVQRDAYRRMREAMEAMDAAGAGGESLLGRG